MNTWQVTYKNTKGKLVTRYYASMATATSAVSRLSFKGIPAKYSPVYQGGMSI